MGAQGFEPRSTALEAAIMPGYTTPPGGLRNTGKFLSVPYGGHFLTTVGR